MCTYTKRCFFLLLSVATLTFGEVSDRERLKSWLGIDLQDGNEYIFDKQPNTVVNGVCSLDNEDYYKSSRKSIRQQCGEVCDVTTDLRDKSEVIPWSGASKHINCDNVWRLSHDQEDLFEWPPPIFPPCCFLNDYLMNDEEMHLRWNYMMERDIRTDTKEYADTDQWTYKLIDEMVSEAKQGILHLRYNAAQGGSGDGMGKVSKGLKHLNVVGKHVLVIGSTSPWVEACALAEGAAHVTTLGDKHSFSY